MKQEYTEPRMWIADVETEGIIAASFAQTGGGEDKPLEDLIINPIDIGDTFE